MTSIARLDLAGNPSRLPLNNPAGHIATSWQDASLAKQWMALADRIGLLAPKAKGL